MKTHTNEFDDKFTKNKSILHCVTTIVIYVYFKYFSYDTDKDMTHPQ